MEVTYDELMRKLKALNDSVWERQTPRDRIEEWLSNFSNATTTERDRLQMLYLCSHFMYFGAKAMRELLRALYRDLFQYPIIRGIRKMNNDTLDENFIHQEFRKELSNSRFLGMGNPSESGCHLLYYFRQENRLPKRLFIHTHELTQRSPSTGVVRLRSPHVQRYIFIDDFCGSGNQAMRYSTDVLDVLKPLCSNGMIAYYALFATASGLKKVRMSSQFTDVQAIYVLDDSYKCLSDSSRCFDAAPENINRLEARRICEQYGAVLSPNEPFGYANGEMLLGFHHNTPDNTLPIFWFDEPNGCPWAPIFRRYPKNYGWSINETESI